MTPKNSHRSVSKWFEWCLYVLTLVAASIVVFVALAVSCDVVARYFFNAPMPWVFNVSRDLLVFLVFLAAAWVLKENAHVKIDLIELKLRPRQREFLSLTTLLMSTVACGLLFWAGVNATMDSFRWGTILPGPPAVHEYILLAVIPFGCFLLTVQFGRGCWKCIKKLRGKY